MFNKQPQPLAASASPAAIHAASPPPSGGVTVPLRYKSIVNSKGETISEIHLRQPLAGDWAACGDVMVSKLQRDPAGGADFMLLQVVPSIAGEYLQRLSGIPLGLLHQMDFRDWQDLFDALMSLIGKTKTGN